MAEPTAETYTNPDSFHKMLAEATTAEQPPEQTSEDAPAEAVEEIADEPAPEQEAPEEDTQDEPEEAPAEEEAEEAPAEEDTSKPVPPSRLKKEIEKRREAEARAVAAEAKANAATKQQEALNAILAKQIEDAKQPKAAETPKEIDLGELDPLDPETTKAILSRFDALSSELKQTKEELASTKAATTQATTETLIHRQTEQFKAATSDFDAAFAHFAKAEYQKALALFGDEGTARSAAQAAVGKIAEVAMTQKRNPAEAIYKMAHAYGYKKAEATPAPKKPAPDPTKVAENRKKTESAASIPGAAPNPLGVYATKEGFEKLLAKPGGQVDPAKFHKLLDLERKGGKYVA